MQRNMNVRAGFMIILPMVFGDTCNNNIVVNKILSHINADGDSHITTNELSLLESFVDFQNCIIPSQHSTVTQYTTDILFNVLSKSMDFDDEEEYPNCDVNSNGVIDCWEYAWNMECDNVSRGDILPLPSPPPPPPSSPYPPPPSPSPTTREDMSSRTQPLNPPSSPSPPPPSPPPPLPVTSSPSPESDSGMEWWNVVIIVLASILLLITIIAICVCYVFYKPNSSLTKLFSRRTDTTEAAATRPAAATATRPPAAAAATRPPAAATATRPPATAAATRPAAAATRPPAAAATRPPAAAATRPPATTTNAPGGPKRAKPSEGSSSTQIQEPARRQWVRDVPPVQSLEQQRLSGRPQFRPQNRPSSEYTAPTERSTRPTPKSRASVAQRI